MKKTQDFQCIRCVIHRECVYQYISLSKETNSNRLLCAECLIPQEQGNKNKEFIDLIPISIALHSPETLVGRIKHDKDLNYLHEIQQFSKIDIDKEFNDQINKFDEMIQLLEELKKQVKNQAQEYKNRQIQFKKQIESFYEVYFPLNQKIQHNKLCQLMYQMYDVDIESDLYQQLANELNVTLDEMIKNNASLITKSIDEIQRDHNQFAIKYYILQSSLNNESYKQINQSLQQYQQFIERFHLQQISTQNLRKSEILTNQFYLRLAQKIEQDSSQQIEQMNLLYLGSKDGLNASSFWSKVNGKKNLLMIFQSKNDGNSVFGGFSPCLWYPHPTGTYVKDETLTAFVFSQTKNEIYPLKTNRKNYAHWFEVNYGPIFGTQCGNDIRIDADFHQGKSTLGSGYQSNQTDGNYLFGGLQPNLGACEIYEVILK